ncbi:MAG TPA: TIGR03086 family metal-binding protein [Acidimicrobiales bacterium]|nr:TIGR03086 family metal-binding protein [Acidimicrobiales bacterium]
MDQLAAHQRAQGVFAVVLAGVRPEQLGVSSPCAGWDAKAVIDHVLGGNQRVQQFAGREADALPDDLVAAHAVSAQGAQETFGAPDGMTRTFELPFGSLPGAAFIGLRTTDVFTHAWDLAKATGQSTDLDPELAGVLLEAARQRISAEFRGEGRAFGEEQTCPDGRCAADQLAAFLGRAVD